MGYHDAYASGVIHAIAGGACLAAAIVLGPRIGKFGPNGEVRDIKPHSPYQSVLGLAIIYAGFWGFYAACNIPIVDISPDGETLRFGTTTIYGTPTTLSASTFNFLMSLTGGLLAGYILSRRDPYWIFSCGLAGIIAASAGNDSLSPSPRDVHRGCRCHDLLQDVLLVGASAGRIDDPVGAIAVHGGAGRVGPDCRRLLPLGLSCGPPPRRRSRIGPAASGWFGTTPAGDPAINPLGMIIGAVLTFGVFGFLATWIVCKALQAGGMLREPREVELAGADTYAEADIYPYHEGAATAFEEIERAHATGRVQVREGTTCPQVFLIGSTSARSGPSTLSSAAEWLLVLLAVVFWIWWHVQGIRQENRELEEEATYYRRIGVEKAMHRKAKPRLPQDELST